VKLDRTLIAVRERTASDVLDLALHVMWNYARPLCLTMLMGVVPFALINFALIGWMANVEEFPVRYIWNLSLLTFLEAQLVSVFATAFLGEAVFDEKPGLFDVVRRVFQVGWQLLVAHGFLRCLLPAWTMLALMPRNDEFQPLFEIVLLGGAVFIAMSLRALRPFITEIAVLEGNPLRATRSGDQKLGDRSRSLHTFAAADLVGRWILHSFIAVALVLSIYGSVLFLTGTFSNNWDQGAVYMHVLLPACMWTIAGYFAVVRFLSYLDLRIRQEGWEVELVLRAEAAKMQRKLTA